MIYNFIAYSPTEPKNLGNTYNQYMELLPNDDDWACFLDHDAVWTTNNWYVQLQKVVEDEKNKEYGLYSVLCSKIGNSHQMLQRSAGNHDYSYHRKLGEKQEKEHFAEVTEAIRQISGVVMLTQKKIWKEVGGFLNRGFFGRDTSYHGLITQAGYKVGIIQGVYVYHWYRGL